MGFGIFTRLCNNHHYQIQNVHRPAEKPRASSRCASLATTHLLFVSIAVSVLALLHKGNCITCGLLWLASFMVHNVFQVYPGRSMSQYLIPFHNWTTAITWAYIYLPALQLLGIGGSYECCCFEHRCVSLMFPYVFNLSFLFWNYSRLTESCKIALRSPAHPSPTFPGYTDWAISYWNWHWYNART